MHHEEQRAQKYCGHRVIPPAYFFPALARTAFVAVMAFSNIR